MAELVAISFAIDPYNPEFDAELPFDWPAPDRSADGMLKDPVKSAFTTIGALPGATANEYEMTMATLKLRLMRQNAPELELTQSTYLHSYTPENKILLRTLLPSTKEDQHNIALMQPTGEGILLPKSYRNAGVLLGDRGFFSYQTATASAIQEQRIPVHVAGFYDPGILPLAGKVALANPQLVSTIRAAYPLDKTPLGNGIQIHLDDFAQAPKVKEQLERAFASQGISPYWKVETFREFDFTKDFLQQLRSERNLFTLISSIILIVACANIVSMLIILVNDKKMEIGILRAMGATSWSIAAIFGGCGAIMGLAGSAVGLIAATITLARLDILIGWISRLQGFDAFNPLFYGDALPNEMSMEALALVVTGTAILSLVAGVIPAIKASFMQPSAILRSE